MEDKKLLTLKQKSFIETVASNFNETDLCLIEKLGIARNTFYKWKKQFSNEIDRRLRELFSGDKHLWFAALSKEACSGNVAALRLCFEMTGEYVPFSKSEIEKKIAPKINVIITDSDVPDTHSDNNQP